MTAALRRHRMGFVAVALAAVAVVLLLFAFDARAWQSSVKRDDIRFRALPGHTGLWKVQTLLPGDPAGAALGTADALAWRHALQLFWYTRRPDARLEIQTLPVRRARAQTALLKLAGSARTASERSAAANLLGVLVVTTPLADKSQNVVEQTLQETIGYFQQAIRLDPSNAQAKQNLELVLRATRPGKGKVGKRARAGFGLSRGHGQTQNGNGY
ncbi:MAG TPA: hypothetical protein VKC62_04740 [Gaiellaceae bacterium]|nr:hypothetical protein [Gaiellaceae bacterium]